ncbi:putative transcriptional regulator [Sphingobium sp. OAS761]|uniref:YqgE/AlgH family protein n=1 Tax=Sphingobium sp. OAS761 TaxID=2817901 RepID=UPI0020A0431D|nr:YqgE/AlgH family protein [Sphingobium sp. OAS761]MCP1471090.1 putative transcriptional regulator [Sphingobium sp. OAS761]
MDQSRFYGGHFLLALPGMEDERFNHGVIALCAHDANGALGIAVGEEMDNVGLHDLLGSFDIDAGDVPNTPVLRGGPVEPRRGFVLHSLDWAGQDMLQVGKEWGLSGSLDILKAIASGRGPSRYLVALGYAGWGAGQLDGELTGASWSVIPGTASLLFDIPAPGKWSAIFASIGIDASHLVGGAGSA